MKKEQLLKLGLSDEQAQAVLEGFGIMIPKDRLDEKIEELKVAKSTINERDEQLKTLSGKAEGNDGLLEQIKQLQADNEAATTKHQNDLLETQRSYAMDAALKDSKVRNSKALKALLNMETVEYKDGSLVGLEEQLTALKESDSYLFETEQAPPPIEQNKPNFSTGSHHGGMGQKTDAFTERMNKYQ